MLEILKNNFKKFAIFVGAFSFGRLFYNYGINFSNLNIFIYFLIVLGICFFVGKSLKAGFKNAIIETFLLVLIHIFQLDVSFKSFLYGVFIFISISSVFNKIRESGKGKDPITGVLYLLIALTVLFIFYKNSGSILYFRGVENITNEILILFGLISLIGSI